MRALVTGATGYFGARLAARLVADGHEVHAITRPASSLELLGKTRPATHVHIHVHDGSTEGLRAAVAKASPDLTFHLASLFKGAHGPGDVVPMIRSNIEFGAQLLDALGAAGATRLVYASTASTHHEGAEYCPATLYAATKRAFNTLADFYVSAHAFRVSTLCIHDTYGPHDPRGKILSLLCKAARTGEVLKMSPGGQYLDLVHIDDVVDAFVRAGAEIMTSEAGSTREYSVTSGRPRTLREVVAVFEEALGRSLGIEFGALPYRGREPMKPWMPGASTVPGWTPAFSLEQGFRAVLQAEGLL